MRQMFENQFKNVPSNIRKRLEEQVETAILQLVQTGNSAIHGTTIPDFTLQVICGKIQGIFSMASSFNYGPSQNSSEGRNQNE